MEDIDETFEGVDLFDLEVGDTIITSAKKECIVYKIIKHKVQSMPVFGLSLNIECLGNITWFHQDGRPQVYWLRPDIDNFPYITHIVKSPLDKDLVINQELEYCVNEIHALLNKFNMSLSRGLDSSLVLLKFSEKLSNTLSKSLFIHNT